MLCSRRVSTVKSPRATTSEWPPGHHNYRKRHTAMKTSTATNTQIMRVDDVFISQWPILYFLCEMPIHMYLFSLVAILIFIYSNILCILILLDAMFHLLVCNKPNNIFGFSLWSTLYLIGKIHFHKIHSTLMVDVIFLFTVSMYISI